jgi:hypothetical protein
MRRVARQTLIALTAICLLAAGPARPAARRPAPTIEPTLPLSLDLRLEPADEQGAAMGATLTVEAVAGTDLEDVTLLLVLPEGVRTPDPQGLTGDPAGLARGERRRFDLSLLADRDGSFPVRVEATFRLPDGTVFRTMQGETLLIGPSARPGRSNAGALEFLGVPLDELRR